MTSSPQSQATPMEAEAMRNKFENAGQGQVFRFWEELSPFEREALLADAREIDLKEITQLVQTHLGEQKTEELDFSSLKPAPFLALPADEEERACWETARERGERALREGKVAAFTVAGGQGTRLGYDGPKGSYGITPVTGKSLFQVFAEKLLAARAQYQTQIPWLIMTSHLNHEATKDFFRDHTFFGLPEADVLFFRQGRMPAVDLEGKVMLESKGRIAMSPDGHGGSLRALCRSGAIEEMERRGIEVISYNQVDNPLVQLIDPTFIGFHLNAGSEMSSKMLPKAYPEEKIGVFVMSAEKMHVVEYSDLPPALAELRDESGEIVFRSGSIAIHLLAISLVKKTGDQEPGQFTKLPFHRADKKIPSIDETGRTVKPGTPNGIKFEMFVFDALPFAQNPVVIETRREDEFSPVKNAEGTDSAVTCRHDQLKQFARWFEASGVHVEQDSEGVPTINLEVSPLFATDQNGFVEKWRRLDCKPELRDNMILE